MRKSFYSDVHQKAIEKDGFFKAKIFDDSEIRTIKEFMDKTMVSHNGWFATGLTDNIELKKTVQQYLNNIFKPIINQYLVDHRSISASVFSKAKGPDSMVGPHRDASFIDIKKQRIIAIWCPLIATNKDNGALVFLPGTHNMRTNPVALPAALHQYHYSRDKDFFDKYGHLVETEPGEAIFFDDHIVHYSYANTTDEIRPTILANVVPQEADTMIYCINEKRRNEVYNIHQISDQILLNECYTDLPQKTNKIGELRHNQSSDPHRELVDFINPPFYKKNIGTHYRHN